MSQDAPKYDDLNNRYPGDFRSGEIILYGYNGTQFDISGLTNRSQCISRTRLIIFINNILFFDTMGIQTVYSL